MLQQRFPAGLLGGLVSVESNQVDNGAQGVSPSLESIRHHSPLACYQPAASLPEEHTVQYSVSAPHIMTLCIERAPSSPQRTVSHLGLQWACTVACCAGPCALKLRNRCSAERGAVYWVGSRQGHHPPI